MKKVLLATTVLAMSATVAAAEVSVSGSARMGVAYNSEAANEVGFTSRARVQFNLSGESDNGLSFGASVRADQATNANNGSGTAFDVNGMGNQTAGSVFVSGAFGKITMGDVDGAAEKVTGDVYGVGLTNLGDSNENTFLSNASAADRTAVRYDYTTAGFTFALSADNPQNDPRTVGGVYTATAGHNTGNAYAVGVAYAVDAYKFGLGYETRNTVSAAGGADLKLKQEQVIASAEGTFGDVSVKAVYGDFDNASLDKQYGLSAQYKVDALTVAGFHRVEDIAGATTGKNKFTGIGASYDLGGGASVVGGIVDVNRPVGTADETRADLGLSFKF